MQEKVDVKERDFYQDTFTKEEILELLGGHPASDMFNFRSPSFGKLGLDKDKLSDDDLISLMLKEPRLVRRPVVRIGKDVYFGADAKVLQGIIK